MRLMTAHRILIVTAILFLMGYAVWELRSGAAGRGSTIRAALAALGAAGLARYFRSLRGK